MSLFKVIFHAIFFCSLFSLVACKKQTIDPGTDPNFSVVANSDNGYGMYNRKVEVFGVPIYAHKKVADNKLLHTANILAQYLDNDENGIVDNQLVLDAIISSKASIGMKKNASSWVRTPELAQDLYDSETIPEWHSNGQTGSFDASLEEVLHVITHSGYANAYPNIFGEIAGTSISNAMDIARGGQFTEIPETYPSSAWYTYDDQTCEYGCMVTEYFYWALTSILGAQKNRSDEIGHEWKLNTKDLVQANDPAIYSLLTDSTYKLPSILPDGTYMH